MISDDYVRCRVAEFAWKQAHGISLAACLAVMFVIRTKAGESGDWLSVIRGFPVDPDADEPDVRDPSFRSVLELVDSVYSGERIDKITNGATHWTDGTVGVVGLERVGSVGNLVLWR